MSSQVHEPAAAIPAARIGPNAVIQTVNALIELRGQAEARRLLIALGRPELTERQPANMIDEREFVDLAHDLLGALGPAEAGRVMARAGVLTSRYVMRNRIPRPVHWLLRALPRQLGLSLLLGAIGQHAWTFAGSGRFSYTLGRAPLLAIENCLTARGRVADAPVCTFYQAAFQGFVTTLIDARLRVHEERCAACGAPRCEFRIVAGVSS